MANSLYRTPPPKPPTQKRQAAQPKHTEAFSGNLKPAQVTRSALQLSKEAPNQSAFGRQRLEPRSNTANVGARR